MTTAIVVFAKEPHAGRVKMRLSRAVGPEKAAALYKCFIVDTLEKIRPLPVARKDLGYMPEDSRDYFREMVAPFLDISTFAQQGDDLGERLQHAFQREFSSGAENIVTIDTSTPTLPKSYIEEAFDSLQKVDAVLGPTFEGGIYLVGSRLPTTVLFEGVPWGTPDVFRQMVFNVSSAGLSLKSLEPWYSVDTEHSCQFMKAHLNALSHSGAKELPRETFEWLNSNKI